VIVRRLLTNLMIAGGTVLMVLAYFFLSAPWGTSGIANSNPRLEFAPLLFIGGLVLAFGSAIVYELLPDRSDE
jgi:uncharacterized membrane protein YphA (DoxX/SURF4 family)